MANQLPRGGATPVCLLGGSPYHGNGRPYYHDSGDSTALGVGDFVIIAGSSNSAAITGAVKGGGAFGFGVGTLATVIKASEGDGNPVTGVVVGVGYDPAVYGAGPNYGVASTGYVVFVEDRANVVFEILADATVAAGDIGNNVNITSSTPNTTTGRSTAKVGVSTKGTGATKQLKLLGLSSNPQRNDGTASNPSVLVCFNNHQMSPGVVGV